jgi:very-long-chain (3R)-3-hydroxyacyl-CoA dehydratase
MQVSSRLLLVWAIVHAYPAATSTSPFYSSMLTAWSVTEVIRYSYFVFNLRGSVPDFLTWLRYNTFYVLYPLGITSEVALVWKASVSGEVGAPVKWVLWGVLGVYVPGSYVLFTHMMAQRRKVLRGRGG